MVVLSIILSVIMRFLRLALIGIVSSLPIMLNLAFAVPDKAVLIICITLFFIASGIDAYFFSFDFWRKRDYLFGLLFPIGIYACVGFLGYKLVSPMIFNLFFLPLRFMEYFLIKTAYSIAIVAVALAIFVTAVRFFGVHFGKVAVTPPLEEE